MRGDSESRSRFLSLALRSRKAIDSLREVVQGHPLNDDLEDTLKRLLAGTGSEGDAAFLNYLQASSAWTSFEELSTVDELSNELGANVGEIVSAVLTPDTEESRTRYPKKLIGFLTAVEGRALQRYTDSVEARLS